MAQRSAEPARRAAPRRRPTSRVETARIRARHRRRRLLAVVVLLVAVFLVWRLTAGGTSAKHAAGTGKGGAATSTKGAGSSTGATTAPAKTTPAAKPVDPELRLTPATLKGIPLNVGVLRGSHATTKVALTFDDGPSVYTQQVLRILADKGVKATFFVVGKEVAARPELVAAEVKAGHVVGDHTWGHADLSKLSVADRTSQLTDTIAAVKEAANGYRVQLMRPPYGSTNPAVNKLSRKLGMVPTLWSDDSNDWAAGETANTIAKRVLEEVRPGSIIIMHDGGGDRGETIAALPVIIEALRQRGLEPVTVPELLNTARPTAADKSFLESEGQPTAGA